MSGWAQRIISKRCATRKKNEKRKRKRKSKKKWIFLLRKVGLRTERVTLKRSLPASLSNLNTLNTGLRTPQRLTSPNPPLKTSQVHPCSSNTSENAQCDSRGTIPSIKNTALAANEPCAVVGVCYNCGGCGEHIVHVVQDGGGTCSTSAAKTASAEVDVKWRVNEFGWRTGKKKRWIWICF